MTPLVLGLALTLAAPAPKKADEAPPVKLEGEWTVESFEGPKEAAPPPGSITMRFADGKVTITEAGGKGHNEEAGYTVDQTKKPAQIDIKPEKGGDKLVLGIFEVKGDTLKICFGKNVTERPTELKPDVAKGIMVINLKRVKADK
jgi:uncharacterized protein (TIGR03067 family)